MKELEKIKKENEDLKRKITIKDKYCELIIMLGFDYDGYNKSENLKELIDELVKYSQLAIECNDTEPMYIDGNNKKSNILGEKIK